MLNFKLGKKCSILFAKTRLGCAEHALQRNILSFVDTTWGYRFESEKQINNKYNNYISIAL